MSLTHCRRTTQIAFILLIFLLPVFNIFRYDTATRQLFLFGSVWGLGLNQGFMTDRSAMGALSVTTRFVLKAILPWLLFLSIFPLLGYVSGRFFCGWLCPEGALFELADYLTLGLIGRRSLWSKQSNEPNHPRTNKLAFGIIALACILFLPLAGGVALTGYLVAPRTIWHQILTDNFTFGVKAGILGISIYMLITSVLVRHVLCRFVCAAGLMQMLFGWVSPISLRLFLDTHQMARCTDCKGCDRACFMNVTPRIRRRDISCVNCGACIEACNRELGKGKGLFRLRFGGKSATTKTECNRETV